MLTELERPVLSDVDDVAKCADTKMLEDLFEKLTKAKDDEQQRNWMLFEDEAKMRDLIQGLSNTLQVRRRKKTFWNKCFNWFFSDIELQDLSIRDEQIQVFLRS